MTGMLAGSKAGHDKDMIYVILKEEKEYVYLVDGKIRTLENPKKKNKKHIQIIKKEIEPSLMEKLQNGQLQDSDIRSVINKQWHAKK